MLSEHDLHSTDPRSVDVKRVRKDFEQFLQNYPAPTSEELKQLQELTEAIGNAWIKGNAEFAYNRVMEVSAKFQHYTKMLDDMTKEKRRPREGHTNGLGRDEIDGHLGPESSERGDSVEPDGDMVFLGTRTKPLPRPISDVELMSSKQDVGQSLRYDDQIGIHEALALLEDVARNASSKLDSTSSDAGG